MGALPDRLPGFQHVENDPLRARFDAAWGVTVPPKRGWNLTGMFHAMEQGELTALYVIGENPVQSEADQAKAIRALSGLEHLVVQDIFLTRTAELADVVLPAAAAWAETEGTVTNSERRVQRVRAALTAARRGARRPGDHLRPGAAAWRHDWGDPSAEAVWDEVRTLSPVHAGMSYARLEAEGGLQWPCYDESHPGELFLHSRLWEDPVPGTPGAVRPGRPRPAGRPPRRRLPDPPDHRPAPGVLQHGRPDGRLSLPAPARRVAGPGAGGRRAAAASSTASACGSCPVAARSRRRSAWTRASGRASPS